ncbi:MAG: hypothetical protein JK586_15975 [Nocardiopsis sp. BM-2018]|nr:MAG: hypothetical protein JK586_15975 [Nocardiopsis sp. BM-2018]
MTRRNPRRRPRHGPSGGPSRGPSRDPKRGASRNTNRRPTRAIATDQGVASRSQSGAFVASWWAERWVAALERLITPLRLARGRAYARAGQVLSLAEQDDTVRAKVQGSRRTPYRVTIGLASLSDEAWERVFGELARRPDLAASLLAGEMPRDIDEVFSQAEASLFPTAPDHMRLECSCPDKVTVCKHIVATCYLMGEQLDEDPFLLFRLRGRGQDEVLDGLRRSAGGGAGTSPGTDTPGEHAVDDAATATANGGATALEAADFWSAAGPTPSIDLPGEHPDLSLLRRLGPFSALDADLVAQLGPMYRTVAAAAEAAFEAADAEPASDDDEGTA